jgi:hypothetical protein
MDQRTTAYGKDPPKQHSGEDPGTTASRFVTVIVSAGLGVDRVKRVTYANHPHVKYKIKAIQDPIEAMALDLSLPYP